MKKLIYIIILLLPKCLCGQVYTNQEKTLIISRVDTLLQNYLQKSGLTLPGQNKRNDKVVADFRSMLLVDAEVFDDINAEYNLQTGKYDLKTKSRNTYIEDLVEAFPRGLIINNKKLNISYKYFERGEVQVVLERNVQGTNANKFTFYNEDTLLIKIRIMPDKSVKISQISAIGSNLKILNDDDLDGVVDEMDECRSVKGLIAFNGCPDSDGDGVPNRKDDCPDLAGSISLTGCPPTTFAYQYVFSSSLGAQVNRNKLSILDNEIPVYLQKPSDGGTQIGRIENPGFKTSLSLNANIAYYFGKNKNNQNKGISLGFMLTNYKGKYFLKDIRHVFKSNDSGNEYDRIITLREGFETISFTMINIPLMLKFKTKLNAKWAAEIGAGPSLLIISHTLKDDSKVSFDFEGKYRLNGKDVYFTEDSLNNPLHSTNAAIFIDDLNKSGYDFGINKNVGVYGKSEQKFPLGLNGMIDLFYHLTPKTALKVGLTATYSSFKNINSNYRMIDTKKDGYKSIYDGNIRSTYLSFGLNAGIIIGI